MVNRSKAQNVTQNAKQINTQEPNNSPSIKLCESVAISGNLLKKDGSLTITVKAKDTNTKYFVYAFSNKDNHSFYRPYVMSQTTNGVATNDLILNYSDMDKPELVFNSEKPKHVRVNVYLEDDKGNKSVTDKNCEAYFVVE